MSTLGHQVNKTHLNVDIIFAAAGSPLVVVVAVAERGAGTVLEDDACLGYLTLWTSSGSLLDLAMATPAALWGRRYGCAAARGSVCTGDMRARTGPIAP